MGAVKSRRQTRGSGLRQRVSPTDRRLPGSSVLQNVASNYGEYSQPIHLSKKPETSIDHGSERASTALSERPQLSGQFSCHKYATAANVTQSSKVVHTPENNENTDSCSDERFRCSRSKTTMKDHVLFQHLNLDTHPAVTRLQNEQNQRLEGMEQRMNKIRRSAQQEAERRKFAHLFRARTEDVVPTDKLLKEASVALQLLKKEKQMKRSGKKSSLVSCDDSDPAADNKLLTPDFPSTQETDRGDIIPVHIVSKRSASSNEMEPSMTKVQQPLMWLLQPVERFHLNGIVLWLVLPFLLPVLLLIHLIRHLSPSPDGQNSKKN